VGSVLLEEDNTFLTDIRGHTLTAVAKTHNVLRLWLCKQQTVEVCITYASATLLLIENLKKKSITIIKIKLQNKN
jgi:hypothetical protein